MRNIVHEATIQARDLLASAMDSVRQDSQLTDDEQLTRYERDHRGKMEPTMQFILDMQKAGKIPQNIDALSAMHQYEQEMERKRGERVDYTQSAGPQQAGAPKPVTGGQW